MILRAVARMLTVGLCVKSLVLLSLLATWGALSWRWSLVAIAYHFSVACWSLLAAAAFRRSPVLASVAASIATAYLTGYRGGRYDLYRVFPLEMWLPFCLFLVGRLATTGIRRALGSIGAGASVAVAVLAAPGWISGSQYYLSLAGLVVGSLVLIVSAGWRRIESRFKLMIQTLGATLALMMTAVILGAIWPPPDWLDVGSGVNIVSGFGALLIARRTLVRSRPAAVGSQSEILNWGWQHYSRTLEQQGPWSPVLKAVWMTNHTCTADRLARSPGHFDRWRGQLETSIRHKAELAAIATLWTGSETIGPAEAAAAEHAYDHVEQPAAPLSVWRAG